MAENVGVSREKLISTSAAIRESNSTMDSRLESVSGLVTELRTLWQSETANNLSSLVSSMEDKFALLHAEVESFSALLDNIAQNYATTETAATDTMHSIVDMFK